MEPRRREQEFLRTWVRHEAAVKCLGTGIWDDPEAPRGATPWIAELDVGVAGAAAISLKRAPTELRCWDWPL